MSLQGKSRRMLSAEQKYELWVRMLTGQISLVDAAAEAGVDRSTISTLRRVARDGAIVRVAGIPSRGGRKSAGQVSEAAGCPEDSGQGDPG